ncbi:hypothetical protein RUM43_006804 [Polyplax serrata]|uniref:Uncharacterized protein n=1 Tax=Polyplax serrata TaxID=468196 RepID=A0AAN8S7G6_POLSC
MIFLMTWAFHRFWLILHFLLVIVNVTESRYLKNAETTNQLSQHSMNALDEDIDLETVVEDYYDDLWQYLETFGDKSKKKFNEEKKKEELGQPNFADYDYMSDMAVAPEPIKDEKTHKVTTEKENGSHGNEQPVNGSQIDLNVLRANRESFDQKSKVPPALSLSLSPIVQPIDHRISRIATEDLCRARTTSEHQIEIKSR